MAQKSKMRLASFPRTVFLAKLGAAFAALSVFAFLFSWIFQPSTDPGPETRDEDSYSAALQADRLYELDLSQPPVVNLSVDYTEGANAGWFPKGESPILAELVREGALRPVAERVGPEPVVMRGVEGIGRYGGIWYRVANAVSDIRSVMTDSRLSNTLLVRWSPLGYPVVPHVAKRYEIRNDFREFIFHLRQGMKWSDGHPFTSEDVLYWWNYEENDPERRQRYQSDRFMVHRGKAGRVERIDDRTVLFAFVDPNPLFLENLASAGATFAPAHYLRRFHPRAGDQALIDAAVQARNLPSARSLYFALKEWDNPDHPRLWPWIYRTYSIDPPQEFVRNPYYFAVDTAGNQLPYLDRLHFDVKSQQMIPLAAANGEITLQARHVKFQHYSQLMFGREANDYDVYHWHGGNGSSFIIAPNLNRIVEEEDPTTVHKRDLLARKEFRQALSLAINREAIIATEYSGLADAVQVAPGPHSPYFEPSLYHAFTAYDPDTANRLLDGIGIVQRDREGYRTFPDGSRMLFQVDVPPGKNLGIAQLVVDDWAQVGVRAVFRERSWRLNAIRREAMTSDFRVTSSAGQFYPLVDPRLYVPIKPTEHAMAYSNWFMRNGYYGEPVEPRPGVREPPQGHPMRKAIELYDRAIIETDPAARADLFRNVLKIAADNVWVINVTSYPPLPVVVKNGFRNVPRKLITGGLFNTPGNGGIETFFFDEVPDTPGIRDQTKREMVTISPNPNIARFSGNAPDTPAGHRVGRLMKTMFLSIGALLIALLAFRHPYIGRRIVIMVPTLALISMLSFTIIQLPPGDFLTSYIAQLEATGEEADMQRIEEVRDLFHLNEGMVTRYLNWVGVSWFFSFQNNETGLLQGNMGRSMETLESVNDLVGDRIVLTVLISAGTILLTWAIAIPVGIFSAVRQYSIADYILTLIGFIGMCIPNFLLALLIMYSSSRWFGIKVSGLFSPEFAAQPDWTWSKLVDLMKHIWVPIVVIGTGGTAAMIRVLRGNLLDELSKPYVVTARAKGVRPIRLLLKYPVRLAINPFISGIGTLFPQLVSGGAIVAIVLSLPTVGPMLLSAIMSEDMDPAGSMLMVLSFLGVCGVLVSDLLLLLLDPRIRFEGSNK